MGVAVVAALRQLWVTPPSGNYLRDVLTLVALVTGIVAAGRTQLTVIASKMPSAKLRESQIQRFRQSLPSVLPPSRDVIFLGDGEFDGCEFSKDPSEEFQMLDFVR